MACVTSSVYVFVCLQPIAWLGAVHDTTDILHHRESMELLPLHLHRSATAPVMCMYTCWWALRCLLCMWGRVYCRDQSASSASHCHCTASQVWYQLISPMTSQAIDHNYSAHIDSEYDWSVVMNLSNLWQPPSRQQHPLY